MCLLTVITHNNGLGQPCIFLGHEFETNYSRLVPIYNTAPMPQSDKVSDAIDSTDQQTVEEQGGACNDQRNSDIRDALEDDQQSADNFGESVDDQQYADNRCKADENEQCTDGLCHVVDDQQAVYSRGAADDHRSEDSRGAADDDQQYVDVRNEEFGGRQLAYCTMPCNICDLPDEILHLIFEHVESSGGTNIGLMRDTWTDSLRVQCLLNDVTQVSCNHV